MTYCAEKRENCFYCLGGVLVVCGRGELWWGRRRRNRGGEGRQNGHILTFADGLTEGIIPSVSPSAILTVNKAHHCMEISVWIPRWFRRHFKRWIDHVTVRSWRFESLDDSVGKITHKNLHVSEPPFFLILNISSVISLVNTDQMCPSVNTGRMTDGKNSIGNCVLKLPTEVCRR